MYNQQIYTFVQVVESGSFSKASEKLFISMVSIRKQINALENHINVKLLERTNQGVILTAAGRSIYEDAKKIIEASNISIKRAQKIAGAEKYTIRIGTSLLRPCKALIDLWSKIDNSTLPFQVKIVPFQDDSDSINTLIASLGKDIDCFVSPCDSIKWKKQCNIALLGTYKCRCAVSRKHKLAKKKILHLEDLHNEYFVLVKRGESLVFDKIRDEISLKHPQIHIIDSPNFYDTEIFNKCEQLNYAMETLDIWTEIHPSLVTIPMDWNYEIPYGIVYHNNPSNIVIAFINEINKVKNL